MENSKLKQLLKFCLLARKSERGKKQLGKKNGPGRVSGLMLLELQLQFISEVLLNAFAMGLVFGKIIILTFDCTGVYQIWGDVSVIFLPSHFCEFVLNTRI